jgi:hypothetical protein
VFVCRKHTRPFFDTLSVTVFGYCQLQVAFKARSAAIAYQPDHFRESEQPNSCTKKDLPTFSNAELLRPEVKKLAFTTRAIPAVVNAKQSRHQQSSAGSTQCVPCRDCLRRDTVQDSTRSANMEGGDNLSPLTIPAREEPPHIQIQDREKDQQLVTQLRYRFLK